MADSIFIDPSCCVGTSLFLRHQMTTCCPLDKVKARVCSSTKHKQFTISYDKVAYAFILSIMGNEQAHGLKKCTTYNYLMGNSKENLEYMDTLFFELCGLCAAFAKIRESIG